MKEKIISLFNCQFNLGAATRFALISPTYEDGELLILQTAKFGSVGGTRTHTVLILSQLPPADCATTPNY